jgi:hypothetical protein
MRYLTLFAVVLALLGGCKSAPPCPPPTPFGSGPAVFNLDGEKEPDGLYRNPKWTGQVDENCLNPYVCNNCGSPLCNTQLNNGAGQDTAERIFLRSLLAGDLFHQTCEIAANYNHFPGHINVGLASFDGLLGWDGVSLDADYDLRMYPVQGGVTNTNPEFVHVEFDSDETLNQFDLPDDSWWRRYRKAALSTPDDSDMMALWGGAKPAAVLGGLLGFDCEHDCHSEIHPVYVLAIREAPESERDGKEHWAIMVRNWGTEGWCSSLNHVIGKEVDVTLPYPGAQAGTKVVPDASQTSFQSYESRGVGYFDRLALALLPNRGRDHTAYSVPTWRNDGVYIQFTLPIWKTRTVVLGEVAFSLTPAAVPQLHARSCVQQPQPEDIATVPDPEEQFHELAKMLPKGAAPQTVSVHERATRLDVKAQKLTPPIEPPIINGLMAVTGANAPASIVAHDREKLRDDASDASRLAMLCAAAAANGLSGTAQYKNLCGHRNAK